MCKYAVSCVDSVVFTQSSFRLPELIKILKNHTKKMHNGLVAHQSCLLLMQISSRIVKKGQMFYMLFLTTHQHTVNYINFEC